MSDDMFDGMITSNGANVLLQASDMFGRQQANNQMYGQQAAGLQQDMMQFTLAQNAQAASERQQGRQFQLQSQQEDRKFAALREESAFARLNQSLDRQLKYAELESQERQQAFDNTLRAQQAGMQAQVQSMQIQQVQTAMDAQRAMGLRTQFKTEAIASGLNADPVKYAEAWQNHLNDNKPIYEALGQTPEGQKMLMEDAQLVQAIKTYSTDLYSIDPDMVADGINVGKMEEIAKNMKLGDGAPKGNDRQVLAYMVRRAEREVTDDDLKAEFPDQTFSGMAPSELAKWKVRTLAAKNDGIDYWDSVAAQLETPAAAAQFETLHANGLLEPVTDKNMLARLQAIDQSKMQMMAQAMAESNGAFLIAPEWEEERDRLDDNYVNARNQVLSGGNASGMFALGGAVDFGIINDKVKEQTRLTRTAGDLWNLTGLPGSWRAAKGFITGEKSSGQDKVDLALTAAMVFVPGAGWVAKGATSLGKAALAKMGVKYFASAAGRAAGKQGIRATAKVIGAEYINRAAARKALAAAATASAKRKALSNISGATTRFRTAIANEAVNLAISRPAAAVVGRAAMPGYQVDYRDLDFKAQRVSEIVDQFKLKSHPPAVRAQLANELGAAMRDYRATAAKYFPDGEVPAGVMGSMLNLGKLVPPTVLRQLQRDMNGGAADKYGGVQQRRLTFGGQISGGLTMVGAPATAPEGSGMDDLFNQPQ